MLKIKNSIVGLLIALLVSSCGEYSKVLNKGTSAEQYTLASKLYKDGKYNKALPLFEKVIPAYRGKPQMERIQFMVADANYQTKNWLLAAYHFDKFTKNYPRSTKREEALFQSAHSYYKAIPRSSLDQSDTNKAIEAFQRFIDTYPSSDRIAQANKYVKEMQLRLEKKAYDIAYQYYHTENYKAAIVAFDNFLSDNLGTSFKEDALFYKSKAAHDLALNSVLSKKEARIQAAIKAIDRFERNFKNSNYTKEAERLRKDLNNELQLMASTKSE